MDIKKNTITSDLNDSFREVFPFLKLEFYKKSHDHFHGSEKKDDIKGEHTLESLNSGFKEGKVEWNGGMSVDNLETYMEDTFGLHVQVFRKSGDIWLQTSVTDNWSLDEQNANGAENEKLATK